MRRGDVSSCGHRGGAGGLGRRVSLLRTLPGDQGEGSSQSRAQHVTDQLLSQPDPHPPGWTLRVEVRSPSSA